MKVVLLYGAPATGKLTIARALSLITGFGVFHNHLAVDAALAVFEQYDDPRFLRLYHRITLDVLDAIIEAQVAGLIFTYASTGARPDPFIEQLLSRCKDDLCPVHLWCGVDELLRRVQAPERKKYRKVTDPSLLTGALNAIDYSANAEIPNTFAIDTTYVPPLEAARRIVEHFRL
jgi:chloramphenicol 3-O-phosphotransferase